jgi:uncharacterized protein YndB with AHSA1/START domain
LIEPEHLTHFWGPSGTSAPAEHIVVEARPGGVFETVMVNDLDGTQYPTQATYVEVSEPDRLVWIEKHSGMTVTVDLLARDDGRTEAQICQSDVPAAFGTPEAQEGFLSSLERLAAYLLTRTAGSDVSP